jgi:hypothetical protein
MKKSAVAAPLDPTIRRAFSDAIKARGKYAQQEARKLASVRSKMEGAQFKKLQALIGKDTAVSVKKVRLIVPKRPKVPFKPYFTPRYPSPFLPSSWNSFEIRTPPYDSDYHGWDADSDPYIPNDPKRGNANISGASGTAYPGGSPDENVDEKSGMVIFIKSDYDASVFVETRFSYNAEEEAEGFGGCAHSQSGLEVVAWRNMAQLVPPQRVLLLAGQSCFGMGKSRLGVAGFLTVPISFQMKAHDVVVVDLGCWIHCDHSGPGYAWAFARAQALEVKIVKVMHR